MNIQGTSVVYMWLVTIVVVERGGGATGSDVTGSDVTGSGPDRKSQKCARAHARIFPALFFLL